MRFLVNFSRLFDASTLNMLPHVIAEGMAPNSTVTIHSVQTPMMLDRGAQISVLPCDIAADFDSPISLPCVTRKVRTFGNHQVTLRGPLFLELQLCGFRICHSFYFIDAFTPVIGGYDLMRAARLVVDVENGVVWSGRSELATKGPIGPNPEFPVYNNSVHSCVAMIKPKHAHRVVVPRNTTSSAGTLDINPPIVLFGNSTSSSRATIQKPSAHNGLVPASRPPLLGCENPTKNNLRSLAGRPVGSAPDDTGQIKHTSKTSGMLASRKRRRQVSDDPLRISAVEPKGPATLPEKLSQSLTSISQTSNVLIQTDQ